MALSFDRIESPLATGSELLDVAAEGKTHGRQHLLGERVLLSRPEAGIESRGQHFGRNRLVDGGIDRPPSLAGVLDRARELRQIRQVEFKASVFRGAAIADVFEDVETFAVSLHNPVFNAVVDHLGEMPGPGRTTMHVAFLRTRVGVVSARSSRNAAHSRRQRSQDWIEMIDRSPRAADHHAITTLKAPNAARGADVDVLDALFGKGFRAANVVLVVRIAAIDNDVAAAQQKAKPGDRRFGYLARRQHDPGDFRRDEFFNESFDRIDACGAFPGQARDRGGVLVIDDTSVTAAHQAANDIATHSSETDHAELHLDSLL